MHRKWNYIEKDGKQLKTVDDFEKWYVKTEKALRKQNKNFDERKFEEETRKEIIAHMDSILSDDAKSKKYKSILLSFIGNFLNKKAFVLNAKYDIAPDPFPKMLKDFEDQLELIPDHNLKLKYIGEEIERIEKTSLDWLSKGADLKDKSLKAEFEGGQKYLAFLKDKIINYQHTPTASAHEKIVAQYNNLGNFVPQEEDELLLAEELENRLIIEGVNYKRVLSERWETFQFDKDYFKKFIPHSLFSEFLQSLYAKIEPWNNKQINRYLTLSIAQFKRFKPEYREKQFIQKFARCYWHPNVVDKIYEDEERAAKFILKEFILYYHLFQEEAEKALGLLAQGVIGSIVETKIHHPTKNYTATNGINVQEFFERITDGNITQIEIVNTVEKLTDNFQVGKLKVFEKDFGLHFMMAKDKYEAQFTEQDIVEAIDELQKAGKPIPYIKFPPLKTKKGEERMPENVIDKEKLLYPYDFFIAYQLLNFLKAQIKEKKETTTNTNQDSVSVPETFDTAIPKVKADFLLKMLEDLGITTNGKSKLGPKGAFQIRAVVEAAIEKNILPKRIIHYTKLIGIKIDHPISSKLARSKDFDSFLKRYMGYIDTNYKAD